LPSYKRPPVVETAIGVQFQALKLFRNVHLWEFWFGIRDEYPETQDQEPLDQKTELFGDDIQRGPQLPQIQYRAHASRLQACKEDRHEMVQIQNGRFVFNWRRLEGGKYPRWTRTSAEFWVKYRLFTEYIGEKKLGDIIPNQWEVTYVNHLMQGQDWQTEADWPELLPGILGESGRVTSGTLEAVDYTTQFALKDGRSRLHIEVKKAALAKNPEQELLVLTLTARGGIASERTLEDCLLDGRRAIVTSFTEITGDAAHERWERTK